MARFRKKPVEIDELVKWADRSAEDRACWIEDAHAALAAAVKHLTGGER